jgi:hypothetical protein
MPRLMRAVDIEFGQEVRSALALCDAIEIVRATAGRHSQVRRQLQLSRVEMVYELAYLRIFVAWEMFLQDSFCRYMCGLASPRWGQATTMNRPFFATLADAEVALRARPSHRFVLWHDAATVVQRCNAWIPRGTHDIVLGSAVAFLDRAARIRHRIVHGHDDARTRFAQTTMDLAHRRYPGARPGRFLRDWVPNTTPPARWLHRLGDDLASLAQQIV